MLENDVRTEDEKIWDHHGSYQWTYFDEDVKERICYFLGERLTGKNLDLGGGWYLHYKNSTVLDLSQVCLDYNPAKKKVHFDLNSLKEGKTLPFNSNSFDSATMVSVWQYIGCSDELMSELKRVIRPGGELYIINGEHGAGLDECRKNTHIPSNISHYLKGKGFDTLIENIPSKGDNFFKNPEFKSVCASIPYKSVTGEIVSIVNNKKIREMDEDYDFNANFYRWRIEKKKRLFEKIRFYPKTRFSEEYIKNCEDFSKEYFDITGNTAILFGSNFLPDIYMSIEEKKPHLKMYIMGNKNGEYDIETKLRKEYDINFVQCYGFFGDYSQESLKNKNWRDDNVSAAISFISRFGINSQAREMQNNVFKSLNNFVPNLQDKIMQNKAHDYDFVSTEFKQRNHIETDYIPLLKKIKKENIPIIGNKILHFEKFLPYIKD